MKMKFERIVGKTISPVTQIRFSLWQFAATLRYVAFVVLACVISTVAWGQAASDLGRSTGSPNTIYYGSNVDQVDTTSGGLRIFLPLLHLPGRGMDTDIVLVYNSKIWQTWSLPGADLHSKFFFGVRLDQDLSVLGAGGHGWSLGVPRMGAASRQGDECTIPGPVPDTCETAGIIQHGTFLNEDGTRSSLVHENPDSLGTPTATGMWSFDGSFMRLLDPGTAVFRDGVVAGAASGVVTLTDLDGNVIRCSFSNGGALSLCTDTAGRRINVNPDSATGLPGGVVYLDSSGISRAITLQYTAFAMDYPFHDSNEDKGFCFDNGIKKPGITPLLTSVTLPNGLRYGFEYFLNPDGSTTGEITKLTLPSGGYVRYVYGFGFLSTDNILNSVCHLFTHNAQNRMVVKRIVSPDGTAASEQPWSYSSAQPTSGVQVMTVTDPQGNSQVYTRSLFLPLPSQTDYKDANGNVLKSVVGEIEGGGVIEHGVIDYVYRFGQNNPRYKTLTTVLPQNNKQSRVSFQYGNYNEVTVKDETDWGIGSPGPLLRETRITYLEQIDDRYFNAHIFGLPASVVICSPLTAAEIAAGVTGGDCPNNNSLKKRSETINSYDEPSYLTTYTGALPPGTRVAPRNPVRGNLTTVTKWVNTSNSTISTHTRWYDTGKVFQEIDAKGKTITYSYDAVAGALPAQICDALNHCISPTFDLNTGLLISQADQNGQLTEYSYDGMLRMAHITYPAQIINGTALAGSTSLAYTDTPGALSVQVTRQQDGTASIIDLSFFDGLDRLALTQSRDPDGDVFHSTTYDSLGRVSTVSNPYRSTTDPTFGLTETDYDSLGRITQITDPDLSTTQTTYTGSAAQIKDQGNGSARVSRISQTDALGRLVSICEVTTSAQAGGNAPSSCNQDISATGFLTTYQYDALDNLISVQQGAQSRTFVYDSLSRLLSATNPESGTTSYTYDDNGNVLTRTRPAPNQSNPQVTVTTNYKYDQVNRLTERSYSDGVTPTVIRKFDTSLELGRGLDNTIGRLSAVYVKDAAGNLLSGQVFGYDSLGRVVENSQCTPQNCAASTAFPITYSYDLLGKPQSAANGQGTTLNYSYNSAGHLLSVTSSLQDSTHPGTLFSATQYNPLGALKTSLLGNGLYESFGYDTRGRLLSYASGFTPPPSARMSVPRLKSVFSLAAGSKQGTSDSFLRRLQLRDLTEVRSKGSILIAGSSPPKKKDRGTVVITITSVETGRQSGSIAVPYHSGSSALAIAEQVARRLNADPASPLQATVKQLSATTAVLELLGRNAGSQGSFYISASVSSKRAIPYITATASGMTKRAPILLGQLHTAWQKEEK